MGFGHIWINWVMECVTTVSYSFLINGAPQGRVVPARGLRQGDPLSPYLFILCTEVLSGLCKNSQENGRLQGLQVAKKSHFINHLLFADDTMFFCKANARNCKTLRGILRRYESSSGQCINLSKSTITYSSRTPSDIKDRVKRALGIEQEGGMGKYLGLKLLVEESVMCSQDLWIKLDRGLSLGLHGSYPEQGSMLCCSRCSLPYQHTPCLASRSQPPSVTGSSPSSPASGGIVHLTRGKYHG